MDLLTQIGITQAELQEKLIERLASEILSEDTKYASVFDSQIEARLKEYMDARISQAFEQHVRPMVNERIDNIVMGETNRWGEAIKAEKPLTFKEYFVKRIDAFITEQVDHSGQSKSQSNSYGWTARTTRISHMIDEYLKYHIEAAVKTALGEVNSSVRNGLEGAVKMALANVKVVVDTKVTT